jgi:hypothetical protein
MVWVFGNHKFGPGPGRGTTSLSAFVENSLGPIQLQHSQLALLLPLLKASLRWMHFRYLCMPNPYLTVWGLVEGLSS